MRILIIIYTLVNLSYLYAQYEVDKVIAVVGNQIILQSDVESQIKMLAAQNPNMPDDARCIIFEQLLIV